MEISEEFKVDYIKLYDDLIETRKSRAIDSSQYYEEHHIVPKSLGGSDEKTNLILLTAKEHYIAHLLLFKIHIGGIHGYKLGGALHMLMCCKNEHQVERYKSKIITLDFIYKHLTGKNSVSYGRVWTEDQRINLSNKVKGEKNPQYGKHPWNYGKTIETDERIKNMFETFKRNYKKEENPRTGIPRTTLTKSKISLSHKGKIKSEEHRKKLSKSLKGRILNEEIRTKMSQSKKGKPQKIIVCPHCGKSGGTTMYRWHFDNCKYKVDNDNDRTKS